MLQEKVTSPGWCLTREAFDEKSLLPHARALACVYVCVCLVLLLLISASYELSWTVLDDDMMSFTLRGKDMGTECMLVSLCAGRRGKVMGTRTRSF